MTSHSAADETATTAERGSVVASTDASPENGDSRANPIPRGVAGSTPNWTVEIDRVSRGEEARQLLELDRRLLPDTGNGRELVAIGLRVEAHTTLGGDQILDGKSFSLSGEHGVRYDALDLRGVPKLLDTHVEPGGSADGFVAFSVAPDETNLILEFRPISLSDQDDWIYLAATEGASATAIDPGIEVAPDGGLDTTHPAPAGSWVSTGSVAARVLKTISGADTRAFIIGALHGDPEDYPEEQGFVAVQLEVANVGEETGFIRISARAFEVASDVAEIREALTEPPILDARLYPGGRTEGWLVLQVIDEDLPALVLRGARPGEQRYLHIGEG
ncbi:MAG: hypothetical protein R3A46_06365 [Thermomicrobiales bacterium]